MFSMASRIYSNSFPTITGRLKGIYGKVHLRLLLATRSSDPPVGKENPVLIATRSTSITFSNVRFKRGLILNSAKGSKFFLDLLCLDRESSINGKRKEKKEVM
jgi:hypothetical protein